MRIKCKIDHISLPIGYRYRLLVKDETIELAPEVGYALLAKYGHALEVSDDGMTQKVIQRSDKVKGPVEGVSNANETLLGEKIK